MRSIETAQMKTCGAWLLLGALLLGGCATRKDEPATEVPAETIAVRVPEIPDEDLEPVDPNVEPPEFAGMVEAHNHWRRQVKVPDLAWSNAAARVAQAWADELARRDCQIAHSPGDERRQVWGENVFGYRRGGAYEGWRKSPEYVVDAWTGEGRWYDRPTNTCRAPPGAVCGHFTQVVSTYSTHVGCGRARCRSAEVWVCNYAPPGNYKGVPPY
jgi:pathogenesis-related protein 1